MPEYHQSEKNFAGIFILIWLALRVFLLAAMPIYAMIKDIEHGNTGWAIADFVLFVPVGTIRGLMYLF